MTYRERIAKITNLTLEDVIENCKQHVPLKHQRQPFFHPELNHGLDLLANDEVLDCYMAAYGEMHHSKCKAVLQNIPRMSNIPPLPLRSLTGDVAKELARSV